MFGRVLSCAVLSLVVGACVSPGVAVAGWPLSEQADVTLGYAQTYARGGGTSVHRGVDLSAEPGVPILAAFGGRVSFAGRVPADGGGTRGAVTIEFGDGLRITCLPLDDVRVSSGQHVEAGAVLGMLAATGDGSSPVPHLHVSIRRADAYLDPMVYLIAPTVSSAPPETAPLEVPEVTPGPCVVSPQPQPAASAGTASAPMPAPAPMPAAFVSAVRIARWTSAPVRPPAEAGIAEQVAFARAARQVEQPVSGVAQAPRVQPLPDRSVEPAHAHLRGEHVEQESRSTHGTNPIAARASGTAWSNGRLTGAAVSRWGALAVAIGACLGLWPLWRRRSYESQGVVVPVGDDVAAAVGR